jgi:hypothetical protein
MANRSDDLKVALPRRVKRMMAMEQVNGLYKNAHERGEVKRLSIQAHANYVAFKLRRNLGSDTAETQVAETE